MKTLSRICPPLVLVFLVVATGPAAGQSPETSSRLVVLTPERPLLVELQIRVDGKSHVELFNEFFDSLFQSLDKDQDGRLNREEFKAAPSPVTLSRSGQGRLVRRSVGLRAPKAEMTKDDLMEYYTKRGFRGLSTNQGGAQNRRIVRASIRQNSFPPEQIDQAIFRLLDVDQDRRVSDKELSAAAARFLQQDFDDNEMIAPDELLDRVPSTGLTNFVIVDGAMGLTQSSSLAVLVESGDKGSLVLANTLLKTYAGAAGKSKPALQLTQQQLGLDDSSFAELDRDSNQRLSKDELLRFADRSPDISLIIDVGKRKRARLAEKTALTKAGDPGTFGAVEEKDGKVIVRLDKSQVVFQSSTQRQSSIRFSANRDQIFEMQFNQADADNNGYLDKQEAQNLVRGYGGFEAVDADGDGMIFKKEFLARIKKIRTVQQRAADCQFVAATISEGKGLFDYLDHSKDGRLSIREMRRAVELLSNLDRNQNQALEFNEIPRRYQVAVQRGTAGNLYNAVFVSSAIRNRVTRRRSSPSGPIWHRKMDRNGDGDVSPREFLGDAKAFDAIDADHDGLISVAEANNAKFDDE